MRATLQLLTAGASLGRNRDPQQSRLGLCWALRKGLPKKGGSIFPTKPHRVRAVPGKEWTWDDETCLIPEPGYPRCEIPADTASLGWQSHTGLSRTSVIPKEPAASPPLLLFGWGTPEGWICA